MSMLKNIKPFNNLTPIRNLFFYQKDKSSASPPAVSGLVATPGNNQVALTWSVPSGGADTYNVKRSDVPGGPYTVIASPGAPSYTDLTAQNGFTYFYVVSAVKFGLEGPNSSEVSSIPNAPHLKDSAMTVVPFSVPFTSTVNVSGGGAALQTAINAAGPGTRLRITDSLAYNPVLITGKTNLGIWAAAGQTPSITAAAGAHNHCVNIQGGNSGLYIKGLAFIGNGNENTLSQSENWLVGGWNAQGMTSIDRVIIEDCTFSEPVATVTSGVPGILFTGTDGSLHTNVWIHRCTFRNNAAQATTTGYGYGACDVSGFSNVYIQNSAVYRDNAVIVRASSSMRGFTWKSANVIVENCLVNDIGTAGSNEAFKHHSEAIFGTAIGNSSVKNCVVYNGHRAYREDPGGVATMTVTQCVYYADTAGILSGQVAVRQTSGTLIFRNCVVDGAGDGTAFEAAVTNEDHNDIFNVGAPGKVLDVTDLTVDPVFTNAGNKDFIATAVSVTTGGSDGGAQGVRYTVSGEAIIWATP